MIIVFSDLYIIIAIFIFVINEIIVTATAVIILT